MTDGKETNVDKKGRFDELVNLESGFLDKIQECSEKLLEEKLPKKTVQIVQSTLDSIRGDIQRHVNTLNKLDTVCDKKMKTTPKEINTILDLWDVLD